MYILWFVKYCINHFLLTWKLLQCSKILSRHEDNMTIQTTSGDIILDWKIKNHGGWVVIVKLLWEKNSEKAHVAKSFPQQQKKGSNFLHAEVSHPLEVITRATKELWDFISLGCLSLVKIVFGKKAIKCSKVLRKRLFFDISSPLSPTFGSKKHLLLVMEDITDFGWSHF